MAMPPMSWRAKTWRWRTWEPHMLEVQPHVREVESHMLEVRHLSVDYGAAPAISGISLAISAGELVCVLGPNGAGKTTLINALAGLHRARAGRILVDGHDIARLASHRFCAAGIAIVPEGRRLFTAMTVRENLDIGSYLRAARKERAHSLEYVCSLFPVIRERLDSPAGALSG